MGIPYLIMAGKLIHDTYLTGLAANVTVGELRSRITGFATIYATGSHQSRLPVRNDETDEFNLRQKNGWIWPITGSCMLSFLPYIP